MLQRLSDFCFLLLGAAVLALPGSPLRTGSVRAAMEIGAYDRELAKRMLSQIREALRHNYYDPSFHGLDLDERSRTYSAEIERASTFQAAYRSIEAFLLGLEDSHTVFVPPRNGKRVAYGFQIKMIGEKCFVTALRPNSDAARKLHLGEQVLSLDGYTVNRVDLWQLEYYLKFLPPKSTTDFVLRDLSGNVRSEQVSADVETLPARQPSSASLSRMQIENWQHNIRSRSAEVGDVFLWKFASFTENQGSIGHMLGEARKHRALVLDLRENGGGLRDNVIFVLGSLFDHDIEVAKEITRKGTRPVVAKSRGHSAFSGQLVVLVDSRSASGSEILARTVQLEHRGLIVGDRSAGSVMTGEFFPLSPGIGAGYSYGVEITVADLVMSDGKRLEHEGVIPDELILPSADDLAAGRDPVLARAAEFAGAKLSAADAGMLFPIEWPASEPFE